jgi:hypothetical protein
LRPLGDQSHELGGVEADRGSQAHDGELSSLDKSLDGARVDVERGRRFSCSEQSDPRCRDLSIALGHRRSLRCTVQCAVLRPDARSLLLEGLDPVLERQLAALELDPRAAGMLRFDESAVRCVSLLQAP